MISTEARHFVRGVTIGVNKPLGVRVKDSCPELWEALARAARFPLAA